MKIVSNRANLRLQLNTPTSISSSHTSVFSSFSFLSVSVSFCSLLILSIDFKHLIFVVFSFSYYSFFLLINAKPLVCGRFACTFSNNSSFSIVLPLALFLFLAASLSSSQVFGFETGDGLVALPILRIPKNTVARSFCVFFSLWPISFFLLFSFRFVLFFIWLI